MALTPEELAAQERRTKALEQQKAQLESDIETLEDDIATKRGTLLEQREKELQLLKKKLAMARTESRLAGEDEATREQATKHLKDQMAEMEKQVGQLTTLAEKSKEMGKHWGTMLGKLGEAGKALVGIGGSIKDMGAQSFALGKKFGDLNKSFGDMQLNISGIAGTLSETFAAMAKPILAAAAGIAAFGVALLAAGVAAVKFVIALGAKIASLIMSNTAMAASAASAVGLSVAELTAAGSTTVLTGALLALEAVLMGPVAIAIGIIVALLAVFTAGVMGAVAALTAGLGLVIGFMDAIIDMSVSLYDAENAFMATTGASLEMAQGITQAYDATRAYGVSVEEAVGAQTALLSSFKEFTMLNKATREELTATTAILSTLGVSAETSAKSFEIGTKMMGVGAEGASEMMLGLRESAQAIGVPVGEMTDAFAQSGGALAVFGEQGVETFVDLQRAAKITGYEMGKILSLTKQFDTFEDAATMTGKLNAALGGNFINAMDMMMDTDPVSRFNSIRDAISEAGLSFDDMSYYQRQMYADALGMSDVGDLALALSGDMSALGDGVNKNTADYQEAAKEAAKLQSVQKQWQTVLSTLIPVIKQIVDDGIRPFMEWLVEIAPVMKEIGLFIWEWVLPPLALVLGAIGLLTAAFMTFMTIGVSPLIALLGALVVATAAVGAVFTAVATAIVGFAKAAWEEWDKLSDSLNNQVRFMLALENAWDRLSVSIDKVVSAIYDPHSPPLWMMFTEILPAALKGLLNPMALLDKALATMGEAFDGVHSITMDVVGVVEDAPALAGLAKAVTVVANPANMIEDMATAATTAGAAPALAAKEAVMDVFAAMPDINLTIPVNMGGQKVGEFVASVMDGKLRTMLTS
tara:strand:- start:1097 stop:3700 length:2604 start_codon:yes stop_codon:yes gene_type:complete